LLIVLLNSVLAEAGFCMRTNRFAGVRGSLLCGIKSPEEGEVRQTFLSVLGSVNGLTGRVLI